MISYLEDTISQVEETINVEKYPKTKATIDNAKDILKDPKFMAQKGVHSLVDQEARVGHKSKTKRFLAIKQNI